MTPPRKHPAGFVPSWPRLLVEPVEECEPEAVAIADVLFDYADVIPYEYASDDNA